MPRAAGDGGHAGARAPLAIAAAAALLALRPAGARRQDGRELGVVLSRPWRAPRAEHFPELLEELVVHVLALVPGPQRVPWTTETHDARLLAADGGRPARQLRPPGGSAARIARFFSCGRRVATAQADGSAAVWDARSGREVSFLDPLAPRLHAMGVMPEGDRVAAIGSDGCVVVRSARSGEMLQRLAVPGEMLQLHALDGDRLVAGVSAPAVILNIAEGRLEHELVQRGGPLNLLEVSPCRTKVVTAGRSGVYVWSAASGRLELTLSEFSGWVAEVALSAGGAQVVSSTSGVVRVWDGATGELRHFFDHGGIAIANIAILHSSNRLAVLVYQRLTFWDLATGAEFRTLPAERPDIGGAGLDLAAAPDSQYVAVCGTQNLFERWFDETPVIDWLAVWEPSRGRVLYTTLEREMSEEDGGGCSVVLGPALSMAEWLMD